MNKKLGLVYKIRNLSINEEEIDRFPPEIDELALILSTEIVDIISREFNIKLSIHEWTRFKAIIQTKFSHTIREVKFTPPPYPGGFKSSFDEEVS